MSKKKIYNILLIALFLVGFGATGLTCVLIMEKAFFTMGAFLAGARAASIFMVLVGIGKKHWSGIFGAVCYLLVLVAACFIFTEATEVAFLLDDNLGLLAVIAAGCMCIE